ncbi:MAG: rRNA maturation RNase YbeY [Candidatus Vogelbacteria bacterium RIFOXYD1_FULL_44_32]|uniref:Endoribonuclease YbeY n=1 Tax=Candidatus Vogelbacteria bacterium RIFOXYD1_FULL_44_32 TaxID=1802438 RepID=A0A1G2QD83_9BACT|nr:MAG: rRNA maturation RNase YbeY [Candidatus Vogelbacteria bacterium RIFOXYD1_FULL_44_32]
MLSSVNLTRQSSPRLPFLALADEILGPKYDLSLVFIGDQRARKLNHTHRGKTYIPNVLSFPIAKSTGEIFINLIQVRRECKNFGHSPRAHCAFIFIHGLLHLKGYAHSSRMEEKERAYMRHFIFNDQKHRHRP